MKPFVVFSGVKDNPIPYEKKFQYKTRMEKSVSPARLPEISQVSRNSNLTVRSPPKKIKKGPFLQTLNASDYGAFGMNSAKTSNAPSSLSLFGSTFKSQRSRKHVQVVDEAIDGKLNNDPLRPHVKSILDMQAFDIKRFQTYRQYSMLHEFTTTDGEQGATLEKRLKAKQNEGLTKRAIEIKKWSDQQKI